MESLFNWTIDNREWLFSGAGLAILAWIGRLILSKTHASSPKTIHSGDNSTNIQASRDVSLTIKKTEKDVGK